MLDSLMPLKWCQISFISISFGIIFSQKRYLAVINNNIVTPNLATSATTLTLTSISPRYCNTKPPSFFSIAACEADTWIWRASEALSIREHVLTVSPNRQ